MYIKSLKYKEFQFKPESWQFDEVEFGQINLIVGKNSSGKSRVISVIQSLAALLAGKAASFVSGSWDVMFARPVGASNEKQEYQLYIDNSVIQNELFRVKSLTVLKRDETGRGFVLKKKGAKVEYQVSANQLMAVVRSDPVQHPQFEHLHTWARGVCTYRFGSEFGKGNFTGAFAPLTDPAMSLDCSSMPDNVSGVYLNTYNKFKDEYRSAVIEAMARIGYALEDIQLIPVAEFSFNGSPPMALSVKEKGVRCYVPQGGLSQGMYRALALFIQFYANVFWVKHSHPGKDLQLGDSPLILIDDIGEGLDHERARKLIAFLVEQCLQYKIQVIMSSNDRYVMNCVPLENWTVLLRDGAKVSSINYHNSKELFDDFSFSGLSNFDFFSGDHYVKEDF